MIMRAMEHSLSWEAMQTLLHDLLVAMGQFDVRAARQLLLNGVQEYRPSSELADQVFCRRESEKKQSKVTSLQARREASKHEAGMSTPKSV
jgi:hypothetical protein